ncbi:MAG: response regulator [Bacteroidota bacterium]
MEKKIILLADDDSDDRDMFCEALSDIDHSISCQCSINGAEALKALKDFETLPKLVFLDLNMPVMNGWECLELLQQDSAYSDIPVIMISTSSHQKDINKAFKQGAQGYLVKPNNFNDLTRILREITANMDGELNTALRTLATSWSGNIFATETKAE